MDGTRRNRLVTTLVAVTLLVAACSGGDQAGELEVGLAHRLELLVPASGTAADCLATGFVEEVGATELADAGIDPEGRVTPADIDRLLRLAPSVPAGCVDLEERLATGIDHADGVLATGCVAEADLTVWPLVRVLLDGPDDLTDLPHFDAETEAEADAEPDAEVDADAEVDVERQLLDAVRGCIDEAAFSRLAGLDDPEELRRVLVADLFTRNTYPPAQDRCMTDAVFDTLGVERLAEIGVTVEQPDLMSARGKADTEELDAVLAAMDDCDLGAHLRRLIETEHAPADCVLDRLTADQEQALIEEAVRGTGVEGRSALGAAENHCAFEATAELYDPPPGVPPAVTARALGWTDQYYPALSFYEGVCFWAGFETVVTRADLDVLERWEEAASWGKTVEDADLEAALDVSGRIEEVADTCLRPATRFEGLLIEADLALDPDCPVHELGPDHLAELMTTLGRSRFGYDPEAWELIEQGLEDIGETVELCDRRFGPAWWSFVGELLFPEATA